MKTSTDRESTGTTGLTMSLAEIEAIPLESRAAVYGRYSTNMQSDKSCEDQEREDYDITDELKLKVVLVEHDPERRAGAWASRDGYKRIVGWAKRGLFHVLVVESINRFARECLRGLEEANRFAGYGVKLADGSGIIDLNTREGRTRLFMALENAEGESESKSIQARRGLRGKAKAGYSTGGQAPYGLKRAPEWHPTKVDPDGRAVRVGVRHVPGDDPVQRAVVLRMAEMVANGAALREIARQLNTEGVATAWSGKLREDPRTGERVPVRGLWTAATVKDIVGNPTYAGLRYWGKNRRSGKKSERSGKKLAVRQPKEKWEIVPGIKDPIIPRELFERVQARFDTISAKYNATAAKNKSTVSHTANAGRGYVLSGLLKCASCGRAFVITSGKRNRSAYRCSTRTVPGQTLCDNKTLAPRLVLEERLRLAIESMVKDPLALQQLVAEHNKRINEANSGQLATVRALEAQRDRLRGEQALCMAALKAAKKAPAIVVEELAVLEASLLDLDAKITEAQGRVQPLVMARTIADYETGDASLFTGDAVRDRAFIRELVKDVLVYVDGSIVVKFMQATLLAPVSECRIDLTAGGDPDALSDARTNHSREYHCTLGILQMIDVMPEAPKHVTVTTAADGNPVYAIQPTGDWSAMARYRDEQAAVEGVAPAPTEDSAGAARYRKRPRRDQLQSGGVGGFKSTDYAIRFATLAIRGRAEAPAIGSNS